METLGLGYVLLLINIIPLHVFGEHSLLTASYLQEVLWIWIPIQFGQGIRIQASQNWPPKGESEEISCLNSLNVPCWIHQNTWIRIH
jgi:hypothetical protein